MAWKRKFQFLDRDKNRFETDFVTTAQCCHGVKQKIAPNFLSPLLGHALKKAMRNHMTKVIGRIGQEHYKTQLTTAAHQLLADEPLHSGGTDLGFSPGELLASSLASCTCITLRMYADRKSWKLESAEVEVSFFTNKETRTTSVV
jgi:hypothetical protein